MARSRQRKQSVPDEDRKEQGREETPTNNKPHPVEWVAGGFSALLVLTMIGFILFQAFTTSDSPPRLGVVVEGVEETAAGFHVRFEVVNRGESTAASVTIEGQLKNGQETVETRDVTLDYVPAHSQRRAGLVFTEDPARYGLQIEPIGYTDP